MVTAQISGQKINTRGSHNAPCVSNNHKDYNAWLLWQVTMACNLDCTYCSRNISLKKSRELHPIDTPRLIKTLDATNKIFKIGFTGGGEPFLVPNIVEACAEVTKKHYVGIVTNLTCDNVEDFAEKINPERVYGIIMSINIKELEKHNLIEKVINNFLLCQRKGMKIDAHVVAYPPLSSEAEKYRIFFKERGIDINFKLCYGRFNNKVYPRSYSDEEIEGFGFNRTKIKQFYRYQGLCNAGFNAGMVEPNGDIHPCLNVKSETMGNIYERIEFKKHLILCPVLIRYRGCSLKPYDPYLLQSAREQNSTIFKKIVPVIRHFLRLGPNFSGRLINKVKKYCNYPKERY